MDFRDQIEISTCDYVFLFYGVNYLHHLAEKPALFDVGSIYV